MVLNWYEISMKISMNYMKISMDYMNYMKISMNYMKNRYELYVNCC